ncbi:hypothetical protein ACFL47_01150 [Candidatus Latescibacterota bacterium]
MSNMPDSIVSPQGLSELYGDCYTLSATGHIEIKRYKNYRWRHYRVKTGVEHTGVILVNYCYCDSLPVI